MTRISSRITSLLRHNAVIRDEIRVIAPHMLNPKNGTAEKPLLIVMALGNILLAQGIYKQLGCFGQTPVQMFWLWSAFLKFTRGTIFPLFKVVSSSLRFWTANFRSLVKVTKHIKYDFFSCWWKFLHCKCYLFMDFCFVGWRKKSGGRIHK